MLSPLFGRKNLAGLAALSVVLGAGIVASRQWPELSAQSTQPSLTITSPQGGETLLSGNTYTIRWIATNFPANTNASLVLIAYDASGRNLSALSMGSVPVSQQTLTFVARRGSASEASYKIYLSAGTAPAVYSSAFSIVTVAPSVLLVHFPFDGNMNDASGKGNNGVSAGVTFANGRIGQAASFDGAHFINAGNRSGLDVTTGITLSAWVYLNQENAAVTEHILSREGYYKMRVTKYAGQYKVDALLNTSDGWGQNIPVSTTALSLNTWYFVTTTYDASTGAFKVFVNGNLENQAQKSGLIIRNASPLVIGARDTGLVFPFKGLIDESKVWNYALTPAQILQMYQAAPAQSSSSSASSVSSSSSSSSSTQPSLRASYPFDGNTNETSGNGNNGGNNGATFTTGRIGQAASFNGQSYINAIASANLNATSAITVSSWVNPGASQMPYADIWGNHEDSHRGIVMQHGVMSTSTYSWAYGDGTTWYGSGFFNLSPNTWQFLTAVKDNTSCYVYINGVEQTGARRSCPTNIAPTASTPFRIGQGYGGAGGTANGRFFNGFIDEAKIWNYARTPAQILQEYQAAPAQTSSASSASAPRCGDGIKHASEQCDDGNQNNTDGCTNSCTEARCGDGVIRQGNEQCDDGNAVNTDACTNACQNARCGDTFIQAGEQCDDGNPVNTDACTNTCQNARCGDTFVQSGEQCDDGNAENNDYCPTTCQASFCGDGFVWPFKELCDDANTVNDDGCTNACVLPRCGDGFVQAGEQCDDGNRSNLDGCTNACVLPRCGDGFVQAGEQCDDGDVSTPAPNNGQACTAPYNGTCNYCSVSCASTTVQGPRCGDGTTQQANEQCDDGNQSNTDSCTISCMQARCGDGFVQAGEQCDSASQNGIACTTTSYGSSCTYCSSTCQNMTVWGPKCGDGTMQTPNEQCDDGNQSNTDSCTISCALPRCGDGFVQANEQCDDANTVNNDGCTNSCTQARCGDGIVRQGSEQCDDANTVNDDDCTNACLLSASIHITSVTQENGAPCEAGKQCRVSWVSSALGNDTVVINFVGGDTNSSNNWPPRDHFTVISSSFPASQGSFTWPIPSTTPGGDYRFLVYDSNPTNPVYSFGGDIHLNTSYTWPNTYFKLANPPGLDYCMTIGRSCTLSWEEKGGANVVVTLLHRGRYTPLGTIPSRMQWLGPHLFDYGGVYSSVVPSDFEPGYGLYAIQLYDADTRAYGVFNLRLFQP